MKVLDRIRIYPRQRRGDARGWLLKCIDGHESGLPAGTGEFYVVMGKPGQIRGGHFHPLAHEWFTLLQGRATLLLADPVTGERAELALAESDPVTIHVPAGLAHAFRAEQRDDEPPMLVCAYSDRLYDPADTVAFPFT
jgi:dTDP-4-dehydrorhamnose 3,5-epimerase-like enzyme